ncbi:MAG: ornithine cyclodeaminase family protein [Methanophagales archaeon ANME-1-THS]|nr:MAG: ornithine cyclodeaminase family protein [Methanophagales archaeon ANME-1-THS]
MKKIEELNAFLITNEELKETIEALGWQVFIAEIQKGFEQSSLGYSMVPCKVYIYTEVSDMRCMPAYLPNYNRAYCGVKIISVAPENPKRGLPSVLGEYLLRDAETQELIAILQAEEMTAYRTGAATGVATNVLARRDSTTLGIIGTGKQAPYQAKAILTVRPSINRIKVYNRTEQRAREFKALYEPELGVDINVVGLEEAVDSDIVTTLTTATEPFIPPHLIKLGTHLNGVGADSKSKIEFDPGVLKKSRIFVDDLGQCIHSGEVYQGLERGLLKKEDLIPLGDVVLGKAKGRTSADDITFFKSTGVAFQDLITAILVFESLKRSS